MAVLSIDGSIVDLNRGWERLVDDPSAAEGLAFTELVRETDGERVRGLFDELREGKERPSVELRLRAGRGRIGRPVHFEGARLDDGRVLLVGSVRDAEQDVLLERQDATLRILSRALSTAPLILWATDRAGMTTHAEGMALTRLGITSADVIGRTAYDLYKDAPDILAPITKALAGEELRAPSTVGPFHFENWYAPLRTPEGELDGCMGMTLDVTERVQTELALREKLDLIERQSATIRALATPIIQVWDDVLCLPVIGTVDSARTADMMSSLLEAIVRQQARYAIVDLTGVEVVDTSTADHLIQLFRAAKVLGVDGVLCGIRPAVAQTVVGLGLDLGTVQMMRSLRDALKWCIRSMRLADGTTNGVL